MNTKRISENLRSSLKSGFFKGVGLGAGLLATSIFAAAFSMHVFGSGDPVSSAQINKNFEVAAPVGAVMAFYLASCPDGWAPADGTDGTPDLRGKFIRGLDNFGTAAGAAGLDAARALGHYQEDAFQSHQHWRNPEHATEWHVGLLGGAVSMGPSPGGHPLSAVYTGEPSTGRVTGETRPKNIALLYCMRKNAP